MHPHPPKAPLWQPSARALAATRGGEAYAVRLGVEPAEAADRLWAALEQTLTPGRGALVDGGTALARVDRTTLDVISGGQDVLDSLTWSIDVTLAEAARRAGDGVRLRVLTEGPVPLGR